MRIYLYSENGQGNLLQVKKTSFPDPDLLEWRGVTVFGELEADGSLPEFVYELFGKAREMADADSDKAQLLLIGTDLIGTSRDYFAYGMDRVFVYDDPVFSKPDSEIFTKILAHFIDNFKPAAILFPESALTKSLRDAVLDHSISKGYSPERTAYKEHIAVAPSPDTFRRGELVICEIPEAV